MNLKHLIGCMLVLVGMISCTQENDLPVDSTGPQTNTVSIQEAQEDLENLLASLENNTISRGDVQKHRVISDCYTVKTSAGRSRSGETDSLNIHVFNFENKQGYAIMSGVRNYPSLIALTDSGELRPGQTVDNPGLGIFMQGLKLDFEEVDDDVLIPGVTSYKKYGRWQTETILGDCYVEWGQDEPYNYYCKSVNGKKAATCCVATAVAQLMSIYKYPSTYKEYSFNWDDMTYEFDANMLPHETQLQVARLMIELGTPNNLDVSYFINEDGESSAYIKNIPRTLKNFGYSNGGVLSNYNLNTLEQEIRNGYGVLVSACTTKKEKTLFGKVYTTYSDGHCWLIHSLLRRYRTVSTYNSRHFLIKSETESVYYPYCNWGWEGLDDGYYLSNAFNPGKGPVFNEFNEYVECDSVRYEGYNFQYMVEIITGIRK